MQRLRREGFFANGERDSFAKYVQMRGIDVHSDAQRCNLWQKIQQPCGKLFLVRVKRRSFIFISMSGRLHIACAASSGSRNTVPSGSTLAAGSRK